MGKNGLSMMLFAMVIASGMMVDHRAEAQTVHVVGDSYGWNVPTNDDFYDDWSDNKIFRVGDILTFNFVTGNHNVAEVTEAAHDSCTPTTTIGAIIATGPINVTLTSVGDHYYICTVGNHCSLGQKLDITVVAAAPSPPAASPPPSATPPPMTPRPTTPPPSQAPPVTRTVHVVGDSFGWNVPADDDFYDNWSDNKIFRVGDILTFNFVTGNDTVAEVTEAVHDACTPTTTIGSLIATGPANVTLTSIGDHYYISTIGNHCARGQKLDITVTAAAPSPPATTPPPSASPPPMTPPPSAAPRPMTSPPSQAPPKADAPTSPSPSMNGPASPTTPVPTTPVAPTPDSSSSSVVLAGVMGTVLSVAVALFV